MGLDPAIQGETISVHQAYSAVPAGASGARYSFTRLVVQVATPVPKKSASSLSIRGVFRDELAYSLSQNRTDQNVRVKDDGALGHRRFSAHTMQVGPGHSRGLAGWPPLLGPSFAGSLELRRDGLDVDRFGRQ